MQVEGLKIIENAVITEPYEFKSILGEGSYSAAVVLALHRQTGQECAVKIIDRKKMSVADNERINREIDINGKISHPNIVQVFEIWRSEEEVCIVMELMHGGELFDRITQSGQMLEADAKRCMKDLLEAVQYLHSLGIAHRDLKPENLLFESKEPNSKLKLIDFGFAKRAYGPNVLETPVGTTAYAAPDIARLDQYTPAVDMWSIGCIFYFMLFSRPPFYSEDEQEMEQLVLRGMYQFPENVEISAEGKDLLSHLLEKKPEKRYSATQALNHAWLIGAKRPSTSNKTKPVLSEEQVKSLRHLLNKAIDLQREDDDAHSLLQQKVSAFVLPPASESALWKRRQKKRKAEEEKIQESVGADEEDVKN